MKKIAGILFFRKTKPEAEVLLGHPGGPFFSKKDDGVWTIPKGEYEDDEDPLIAAIRETEEETGIKANGDFIALNPVKLKSGKVIQAWALESDFKIKEFVSNSFLMEWPPNSGQQQEFPEIDRISWFSLTEARVKIHGGQLPLLAELEEIIKPIK